jgi:hypothetical protein
MFALRALRFAWAGRIAIKSPIVVSAAGIPVPDSAIQPNGARLGSLVLALLIAAALALVLLVRIPAMVDYLNHLARMYLISAGGSPYYRIEWALYPNLAMDLIVPQMGRLVGVETAMRLFLLVSQLLIVSGAMAIEYVVKRRFQLAGFAAVLFLYCLPFAWGFLNYEMAQGLALWGIAVMLALDARFWPLRLAVHTLFVAALFAAHFFAFGIYGAVLGVHELWRAWQRGAPLRETAPRLLLLAAPAAAVLALMALGGGAIGNSGTHWHFGYKPYWLFAIMSGYSLTVSSASVAVLVGWLALGAKRGVLRFAPAGLWLAAGFALLYLAMPDQLFGVSFVDQRVLAAAALVLPAFLTLSLPSRRWLLASLAMAIALTLANLAVVSSVWLSYRADYAAMIASFGRIEKGAHILVAHSGTGDDPPLRDLTEYPIYHAPTLAVHYADAFVPNLFTATGKQPLRARAQVARLDIPEGGPIPLAVLTAIAAGKPPAGTPEFVRTWNRDYDYLYVLGPQRANPLPALLQEVTRSRRFVLYRVRRAAVARR